MFQVVFFDLDGTLLDTEQFQFDAWKKTLEKHDATLSLEKYQDYAGAQGIVIASRLINDVRLETNPNNLLDEKRQVVKELISNQDIKLMPHAHDAIKFFQDRGLKTVIVSGGHRDEVSLKIGQSALNGLVDEFYCLDDVDRGKPAPDVYKHAMAKIGVGKNVCIAFEDTQAGVESAKAAGLTCIAVPTCCSERQDFSKADNVCKDLKQALDFLKSEEIF